jgi:branched-chain amino acid transport system permease protein
MITLGIGELVYAASLMLPQIFGGEAGVSGNRAAAVPWWGLTFGPALQVYYLIAAYTLLSVAALYAFTATPLGRLLNAVRDNAERLEFIGYSPQRVRYMAFVIAGFFAGIAGALGAIVFETVNSEAFSASKSGAMLLFTYLGGTAAFYGPILGGVLMVLSTVLLSDLTQAWLLYLGLLFMAIVVWMPGGLASWVQTVARLVQTGRGIRCRRAGGDALPPADGSRSRGRSALFGHHLEHGFTADLADCAAGRMCRGTSTGAATPALRRRVARIKGYAA